MNMMVILSSIVFVVTVVIILMIQESKNTYIEQSQKMLYQEAMAHYDNMVNTRSWNAKFSGVFVLPLHELEPNPYLEDNHIYTKDGTKLIKINPAWMTRQISEISNQKGQYFFKMTSLNPINPQNKPDVFETEALKRFDESNTTLFYTKIDDQYYHFMGALKVNESCLECHATQGYKVGDTRGGLRVSIPLEHYTKSVNVMTYKSQLLCALVIIIAFVVTFFIHYLVSLIYIRQKNVEELNRTLEEKVKERTESIEILYEHEKYLKGILKIIAHINETFMTSYSIHTIAKNCISELAMNESYGKLWIGFIRHDQKIDILAHSKEMNSVFTEECYEIGQTDIPEIMDAYSIYETKQMLIQQVIPAEVSRRVNDFNAKCRIYLPIRYSTQDYLCGVLVLSTNREVGFLDEEINILNNIVKDIALSIETQTQKNMLEQMEIDKIENYENTILAFVHIIEQRDSYTAGHTLRVAQYCRLIAEELNIQPQEIKKLEKAAILHDIGKVATPDAILLKPGKLTKLEYELIKIHSKAGYEMLSKIDMYKELAEIVKYHHSRYDGKGYPDTTSFDEIPFLSHIMIVADAFDAMTTNRIYKPRLSVQEAILEIKRCSGTQFHPEVAIAAQKVLSTIEVEDNSQMPSNELEKKRFSYFFLDSLTALYNESYLQIVLANTENHGNHLLYIELHHFSAYNKQYGWEQGNFILKQIAQLLLQNTEHGQIFRFHGDDFIIVTKSQNTKLWEDPLDKLLMGTSITVNISEHIISNDFLLNSLK